MSQFSFHKRDRNLLCFASLYLSRSYLVLVAYKKTNIPCFCCIITWLCEITDVVNSITLKFPAVLKFPADDLQFPAVVFLS